MKLLFDFWTFWDSLLPYLPFVVLGAGFFSFYKAIKNRKGGYEKKVGGKWVDGEGLLPITQIPAFWFGVALVVFAIIIYVYLKVEG